MKKRRNIIITAAVIIAALTAAWFYGGNYGKDKAPANNGHAEIREPGATEDGKYDLSNASGIASAQSPGNAPDEALSSGGTTAAAQNADASTDERSGQELQNNPENGSAYDDTNTQSGEGLQSGSTPLDGANSPEEAAGPDAPPEPSAEPVSAPPEQSGPAVDATPGPDNDTEQGGAAQEAAPLPGESQDTGVDDGEFTITLTVRCDTLLNNMSLLREEKRELVGDGVIFPATVVIAYDGESVFNVLQREMRRARIHMEFRNTPIYNSAYILGINNLYEFDAGELSGWIYCVAPADTGIRWYPNYGCSRYQLSPGDVVEFNYTCDHGRDLGQYWLDGDQRDE